MRLAVLAGLVLLCAGWAHGWNGQGAPAPPIASWLQPGADGITFCAGAGVNIGSTLGPGCLLDCVTDGACATFVRDAQLRPVHFSVWWYDWEHGVVEGRDTDGLYCTFIGDMYDGRITVVPDPDAGPAGIMNTQEDEGQFCNAP